MNARGSQNIPILIAHEGPLQGSNWEIGQCLSIGRDEGCDITIQNRQVSRRHAEIQMGKDGDIKIEDLGSKNGTFVNEKRITHPFPLNDGDAIKIALIQELLFVSSDSTLPLDVPLMVPSKKSKKLFVDEKARRIWVGDVEMLPTLSVSQYKLLNLLYKSEGSVVSRDQIVATVWGDKAIEGVTDQALDALVRRLRSRLKQADPNHEYLTTVRGVGFVFNNDIYED